jgi:hypothetical protein
MGIAILAETPEMKPCKNPKMYEMKRQCKQDI